MPEFNWYSFFAFTTVSYIACSFFFLKYPHLLHKKKIYKNKILQTALTSNKVIHISHRGGVKSKIPYII